MLTKSEQVEGIIAIGSSMGSESVRSRELGCWNGPEACSGLLGVAGTLDPAHDFEPGDGYVDFLMEIGYGKTVQKKTTDFWARSIRSNYLGDAGRRRICMAAVNLAGRDGLRERLPYITCPVLWLQVFLSNPSLPHRFRKMLTGYREQQTLCSVSQTLVRR